MGRRGPKPTGTALSNADRQRLWRQRQKAHKSVTIIPEKPNQTLECGPVTEKLLEAFNERSWGAVIAVAVSLGFQPPPFDPTDVVCSGVDFEYDTGQYTISLDVTCDTAIISALAWGATNPAVLNATMTDASTCALITTDPLAVLDSLSVTHSMLYTESGNQLEFRYRFHNLLPAILPYRLPVAKQRTEKQHLRWVKANAKGRWARKDELAEGRLYPEAIYYFELLTDATLAKMIIGS
jgi:hypothetical protein